MPVVEKGMLSRLRRPKKSVPFLRTGVTRMGTVGVEYVHEGMKGWGGSETAARAAWEQNRALRKRDEWAADLSVQPPPEYRGRRANYRSGTAKVGKRMTGAVAGVGSPKKVQPTRVAGRRTPGAGIPVRDMSQPPIEPSRIGKSVPKWYAHGLSWDSHDKIARALERGARGEKTSWPKTTHYVTRPRPEKDEEVVETYRRKRGKVKSYGVTDVRKRDRKYNPESSRQRRLGITAAATGLGGAALAVRGGRSIARDTRGLRRLADREGHRVSTLTQPGAKVQVPIKYEHENTRRHSHTVSADERTAIRNMAKIPGRMVSRPSRRQLAQVGGGAALVGASGTTVAYGRSRSNREWR